MVPKTEHLRETRRFIYSRKHVKLYERYLRADPDLRLEYTAV
ncbi:MAG: hypothetical protein ACOCWH_01855 [Spirochaetota bacterium]